jgi:hypothetical protein
VVAVAKSATCIEYGRSKYVETDGGPKSRNMSRYPIVLKDYGIVAYFVRGFRYNEQALVYSGLLACNAALASKHAVDR